MPKLTVRNMILTALMTALTAVGAFIRVPTGTVSFTLQILFVFLAGILLGPGLGALSQLLYLLIGLAGVPVFTGGGGLSYVFQPSFGFLAGYIAGAAVTGALTRKKQSAGRIVGACLAGLCVIYAVGLPYMALILNVYLKLGKDLKFILVNGMLIFLPWDALKIAAAAVLSRLLLPALKRL